MILEPKKYIVRCSPHTGLSYPIRDFYSLAEAEAEARALNQKKSDKGYFYVYHQYPVSDFKCLMTDDLILAVNELRMAQKQHSATLSDTTKKRLISAGNKVDGILRQVFSGDGFYTPLQTRFYSTVKAWRSASKIWYYRRKRNESRERIRESYTNMVNLTNIIDRIRIQYKL